MLARDIKLSHSLFALPFALLAAYLAASHQGMLLHRRVVTLGLILGCMVTARTVAMTVNRLADRELDAANPRTAGRALPSGRLSVGYMRAVTLSCIAAFVLLSAGFWWREGNPWPVTLSPAALAILIGYSYAKRWTAACHLLLGLALGISPLAAVIAVNPDYFLSPVPWLLGAMVLCWVAGFDVIYALQDVEFDRQAGLHSIPARLGVAGSLGVSRGLHLLCFLALLAVWRLEPRLDGAFGAAVILVAGLLILEHWLVRDPTTGRIRMAFFTVNGVISLAVGALGIIDVLRLTPGL
ncbi:MAG: UbiA family prenyltransferase [Phycisphaeraceae bacterium]|nr:UbiA family prenyltransferase [Phycisphaeraceae bacterium]